MPKKIMHVQHFVWELLLFYVHPYYLWYIFFIIVKDPSIVKTYVTCCNKGVKQTIPAISILCLYDAWIIHHLQKCTGVDE